MRIGSIIIFPLSKRWKVKFFILCGVIFLVRLQGKLEIYHSRERVNPASFSCLFDDTMLPNTSVLSHIFWSAQQRSNTSVKLLVDSTSPFTSQTHNSTHVPPNYHSLGRLHFRPRLTRHWWSSEWSPLWGAGGLTGLGLLWWPWHDRARAWLDLKKQREARCPIKRTEHDAPTNGRPTWGGEQQAGQALHERWRDLRAAFYQSVHAPKADLTNQEDASNT